MATAQKMTKIFKTSKICLLKMQKTKSKNLAKKYTKNQRTKPKHKHKP